jgi:hypothetical protein
MCKVSQPVLTLFVISLLFFSIAPVIQAQEGRIYLEFENQSVSANIKGAPLKAVIKKINSKQGIWFKKWLKGSEFLFNEKVSLRCKNIPVHDAMEQIFSGINHAFIFDGQHSIEGVFLFGKSSKIRYRSNRRSPRRRTRR